MQVSQQGYYQWLKSPPSRRECRKEALKILVLAEFGHWKERYGSPRIYLELKNQGVRCSRKTVALIMQLEGIRARAARKYRATTNSKHQLTVADNLLNRDFKPPAPNRVWAGDITYLWTREGWMYLAVFLDLYSRRVVGWAVSKRIDTALVSMAFQRAIARRSPAPGLIIHSDRGVQYASNEFKRLLINQNAIQSMSRKGDCWDNAVVESFFHSFKVEATHGVDFKTRKEVEVEVFDYIERFYNKKRRHSSLEFMSPNDYEMKNKTIAVG